MRWNKWSQSAEFRNMCKIGLTIRDCGDNMILQLKTIGRGASIISKQSDMSGIVEDC